MLSDVFYNTIILDYENMASREESEWIHAENKWGNLGKRVQCRWMILTCLKEISMAWDRIYLCTENEMDDLQICMKFAFDIWRTKSFLLTFRNTGKSYVTLLSDEMI